MKSGRFLLLLVLIAGCGHAGLVRGQPDGAMPVTYHLRPGPDGDFRILDAIIWEAEGQTWQARFTYPPDWPGVYAWREEHPDVPPVQVTVTGPAGTAQDVEIDPPDLYQVAEDVTGTFVQPPDWRKPWWPGSDCIRPFYLAETAGLGNWRIMRIMRLVAHCRDFAHLTPPGAPPTGSGSR